MASRARDVIDTGPLFSQADAIRLNNLFRGNDAGEMLAAVVADGLVGSAAIVSSFGAESAVLLHLVTRAAPDLPVLFLDTGKHFDETLAYRDLLADRLTCHLVTLTRPDETRVGKEGASHCRLLWCA